MNTSLNTVRDYLDAARAKHGIKSDRALSVAMGLKPQAVCDVRLGKSLPSDATMLRLCELAGADPTRGLIQLNVWRASSSTVADQYSRILLRIAGAVLLGALVMVNSNTVEARTITEHRAIEHSDLYIMRFMNQR